MTKRNHMNECHKCKYKRNIPGDCHIACAHPDPAMKGNEHGIRSGWFHYPLRFDPVWKLKACANYYGPGMTPVQKLRGMARDSYILAVYYGGGGIQASIALLFLTELSRTE